MLEEVVKQEKMLDVFKEYLNWSYIMGLNNAGDVNLACKKGYATDLINVTEALQEKKIAQIADTIFNRGKRRTGEAGSDFRSVFIGKNNVQQAPFDSVDDERPEALLHFTRRLFC